MKKRTPLDEAADPETPFQRLLQLSESDDVEVRRALVDNPSIAVDEDGVVNTIILEDLTSGLADHIIRSPAFALFGLELHDEGFEYLAILLAREASEHDTISILYHSYHDLRGVRDLLAQNPNTPQEILRTLGDVETEQHSYIRALVAINPSTSPETLGHMAKSTDQTFDVLLAVAQNHRTPPMSLLGLFNRMDDAVFRNRLTSNPSFPQDHLNRLAEDPFFRQKEGIAINPKASPKILRKMYEQADSESLRVAIASNPNCDIDLLWAIGRGYGTASFDERFEVVNNPSSPMELIDIMIKEDPDPGIRRCALGVRAKRKSKLLCSILPLCLDLLGRGSPCRIIPVLG